MAGMDAGTSKVRAHIRSNVVGYIALFCFAIGGTAIAAHGGGTVTSRDIVNGQVKKADIASDAVTQDKIAPNAVGGAQVNEADLDSSVLQFRVSGNCAPGEAIRAIAADGTVSCEADDVGSTGPATDVVCSNCISDSEVADNLTITGGTVSDSSLSGNVALLNADGTFTGRPSFNGGTSGVSSPFSVDSTSVVTNLNADLLDGQSGSFFQNAGNLNAGTIDVARLANIPNFDRGVNLPLGSFARADGQPIGFTDAVDDFPSIAYDGNREKITYDTTAGSVDTQYIGSTFMIPRDYATGGSIVMRLATNGVGGATETMQCRVAVDGGTAVGTEASTNIPVNTDVQTVTVTPVPDVDNAYGFGKPVTVSCRQSNASANNDVLIYGMEFRYTSEQ